MPIRMETTVRKIDLIPNTGSRKLITEFHAYLKDHGNSERDQHNYLKVLTPFALYLGPNTSLSAVYDQAQVTAFSDTKKKDLAVDRNQKWIVTWNSYLARIRHFYRWLYSQRHREPIPQGRMGDTARGQNKGQEDQEAESVRRGSNLGPP
jgi:integrase/recombinase XerD